MTARCPVCLQPVTPTRRGNIAGHLDSIRRDVCPASGHPIEIAYPIDETSPRKKAA